MSVLDFSAVVINYNGSKFLVNAVTSLLNTGISTNQVIVVDNGSSDNSISDLVAKYPLVSILRIGCNAGFARAVNKGLVFVKTKYVLIFNNDAVLDANALIELEKAFELNPSAAILGAKLLNFDGTQQNSVAQFPHILQELIKFNKYRGVDFHKVTKVDSVVGACMALRMDALRSIGKLDEDFFFFLEETELCLRASRLGYDTCYVPSAVARHAQGGTAKNYRAVARIEFQRSKLVFYKKTAGVIPWFFVSLILFLKAIVNFVFNLIALLLSAGFNKNLQIKTASYFKILLWHILFRPKSWGLPNKCH